MAQFVHSRRHLVVITDLDGCLLSEKTHSCHAANAALSALREIKATLVLASAKTRRELESITRLLRFDSPLIIENGGALLIPTGQCGSAVPNGQEIGEFVVVELGTPRSVLVSALTTLRLLLGAQLRSFSEMTPSELTTLTGLSEESANQALCREFDEPFLLERLDELGPLRIAASDLGLRISDGGKFLHLTGPTNKGKALRLLLDQYKREGLDFDSIGLGDSENDIEFLRVVDVPILIPRADGQIHPVLKATFPRAKRASEPGPKGWNDAVLSALKHSS